MCAQSSHLCTSREDLFWYYARTPLKPARRWEKQGLQEGRKREALWDHQHQRESCKKNLLPNIFLGTCHAGTTPRDSLLRESFRIPAAGRVTGPVVTNRPLGWEASACSGVGPRKSRPAAPGGEGKQQGPCHGELFPPGKSNRAARGQEPEKSMFPRYNSGHPQFLQGPGRLICPLCELIGACHLRNHRAAECCS